MPSCEFYIQIGSGVSFLRIRDFPHPTDSAIRPMFVFFGWDGDY